MEITTKLELTFEEESIIEMHSVLNVINVITIELSHLDSLVEGVEGIPSLIKRLHDLAERLHENSAQREIGGIAEEFVRDCTAVLATVEGARLTQEDAASDVAEILGNLESIFSILAVRSREMEARSEDPNGWVVHSVDQLVRNFQEVVKAIERNGKGKYRIVGNCAEQDEHSYLLNLGISSVDGDTIYMPAVFQDIFRDLIANSRKYTDPGGTITAGIYNGGEEVRLLVCDTGRGIPHDEVEKIIAFGVRGSNVLDHPTRGGGFGLTKAYYKTKQLNGRMWIDDNDGMGTRIEIRVPVPAS